MSPKSLKGGKIGGFDVSQAGVSWTSLSYRCIQHFSNTTSATTTTTTTTTTTITTSQTTSTPKVCQYGWNYYHGTKKCYKVFRTSLSWFSSRYECQKYNANPSMFTEEEGKVIQKLQNNQQFETGLDLSLKIVELLKSDLVPKYLNFYQK